MALLSHMQYGARMLAYDITLGGANDLTLHLIEAGWPRPDRAHSRDAKARGATQNNVIVDALLEFLEREEEEQ